MIKFYWHIHHNRLFESAKEPISNRKTYIKQNKPKSEQKLRLKLLKPIKLTQEIKDLLEVINDYYDYDYGYYYDYNYLYNYTYNYYYNYNNYFRQPLDEQILIYCLIASYQLIEELHEEQCPNCPWDGKSIFSNK